VRLLVVEDETMLAEAVATGLRRDGYAVDVAHSGGAAAELLGAARYDLVSLDLTLPPPGPDGPELCRRLRAGALGDPATRVLMVTARDAVGDRVAGLDGGADDYLVKPFALDELRARVRCLLRRPAQPATAVVQLGRLIVDTATLAVTWDGTDVVLSPKEFAVLRYLAVRPGVVVSQEELLDHVWDRNADPFTETVRVTVGNLRRKLAAAASAAPRSDSGSTSPIETVTGCGYRLRQDRS
jgi:DNA-binding response OmpR family regulator